MHESQHRHDLQHVFVEVADATHHEDRLYRHIWTPAVALSVSNIAKNLPMALVDLGGL